MRWLFAVIGAISLGIVTNWKGGLVGLVVGFFIGAWIEKKVKQMWAAIRPAKTEQRVSPAGPPPLTKPTRAPAPAYDPGLSIRTSVGDSAPVERSRGNVKLTWYPAGQPVSHSGLRIGNGMIYSAEKVLGWPGEPSAIITSLSVGRMAAHPLQDFGYYPSYENLTAEQRRCYLEWLAAGREDADPSQRSLGYVFMFFYGLERRILTETLHSSMRSCGCFSTTGRQPSRVR
jgi:hypothetical protein